MSEPTSDRTAAPHVGLRAYVPGSFTRRAIPVTVGVPFARGAIRETAALGARRRDGSALPIQIRTLDRWGDGSIRWALIDLCAEPAATNPAVEIGPDLPKASMRDVITAAEGPDGIRVNTGAAILEAASRPEEIVRIRLRADTRTVPLRLTLQTPDGNVSPVTIDDAQIEERGPLRLVVKLEGRVDAGDASLDVLIRLHAFAGLGALKCDVTLRNPRRADHDGGYWDLGDPGSALIRRWTLQLGDSDASYE